MDGPVLPANRDQRARIRTEHTQIDVVEMLNINVASMGERVGKEP
jgi:hypothetical protein